MKKLLSFFPFLLFIVLLSSWRIGPPISSFTISGNIAGLGNDSVFVHARIEDENGNIIRIDTFSTKASKDRFTISGKIGKPSYSYVYLGNKRTDNFSFILEKGKIIMLGTKFAPQDVRVSGTRNNYLAAKLDEPEQKRYKRIKNLYVDYATKDESGKEEIENKVSKIRDSILADRIKFVENYPDAMQSAIYLYVMQDNIRLEKLESLYSRLSSKVKNNSFGKTAAEKIIARKRTTLGNAAPAFTINDEKENPVSLSNFKGKYVLLEFWASWCVPCRQEIPAIKEAYQKFSDKGFAIISISVDTDKAKWIKALQEENLPWSNVRDILGTETSIAKLYGVQPIPDNFLISPEGKIIARGLRGKALEAKLASVYNN